MTGVTAREVVPSRVESRKPRLPKSRPHRSYDSDVFFQINTFLTNGI